MFMYDLQSGGTSVMADEFSRYCKDEGLDHDYILSQAMKNKCNNHKNWNLVIILKKMIQQINLRSLRQVEENRN